MEWKLLHNTLVLIYSFILFALILNLTWLVNFYLGLFFWYINSFFPCLSLSFFILNAADNSWSMFNYRQSLAFDLPYLSCNDHCDQWLFQRNLFIIIIIIIVIVSKKFFWMILNLFPWTYLLSIRNSFLFRAEG